MISRRSFPASTPCLEPIILRGGPSGKQTIPQNLDRIRQGSGFSEVDQSKLATLIQLLLIIAGIEQNPGPPRWPCGSCGESAAQRSLECVQCRGWFHFKCAKVDTKKIPRHWECPECSGKREWPCGKCGRNAAHSCINCTGCDKWYHFKCIGGSNLPATWLCDE